jgi:RNA recognition motif-containing protein
MSNNIYVGNLSPGTTQEEIRQLFEQYGKVDSVDLITDRYTGAPRGFGFVKMAELVPFNSNELITTKHVPART